MTDELEALLADGEETGEQEVQTEVKAEDAPKEETPTEPEVEAKTEDEPEAKKDEESAEVTPTEETEEPWTKKAFLDEKRKRQELERQIEELKSVKQEQAERPDVFEDQEGAFKHEQAQRQQEIDDLRMEIYRESMVEAHSDYEELESEFVDLAKAKPALMAEFLSAKNKPKFAYETAKQFREMAELKNVDALKERIKAEAKAELEAELKAEQEAQQAKTSEKQRAISTPSLAAVKGTSGTVDDGEDSLESLTRLG